ncbi:hypothetical protein IFM89_029262 [Coptis chinensis]|uniref:Endonuclease/exonuclease/phosphatase domain-containing protein n=1 Tax=Coptis chinensis TaxID=261450 RepID=A0A835LFG3_9MAGN|nr:hypothetical protein IFM89_029262 [Coptis chinensis]
MKTISWNCRGCGGQSTIRQIKNLISKENPDIIFLSETKSKSQHMQYLSNILNYPFFFSIPAINSAGGLCLMWKAGLHVNILNSSLNHITTSITYGNLHIPWTACFFYGSPYKPKDNSWNPIRQLSSSQQPILIIGDMNIILSAEEQQGGRDYEFIDGYPAHDIIRDQGLLDLGFKGSPFTWSNKRVATDNIQKRLDRALSNSECHLLFPNATLHHLPAIESDHCPILLNTHPTSLSTATPFKFHHMWIDHPDYSDIISMAWHRVPLTLHPSLHSVSKHLASTKKALKIWNQSTFGNIFHQLSLLNNKIACIQSKAPSKENVNLEHKALSDLDHLLASEEKFWKQKSNDKDILEGDRNTKYFHIKTLRHRHFNKIVTIKNSDGVQSIAMGLMIQSPPLLCPILAFFFLGSAYSFDMEDQWTSCCHFIDPRKRTCPPYWHLCAHPVGVGESSIPGKGESVASGEPGEQAEGARQSGGRGWRPGYRLV